jgi:hypothetical protein
MIQRSLVLLSKASRTIVRDPRKQRALPVQSPDLPAEISHEPTSLQQNRQINLPFEPTQQNQQAIGSTLASYMVAGAGMAVGFTIVGAIFGGV